MTMIGFNKRLGLQSKLGIRSEDCGVQHNLSQTSRVASDGFGGPFTVSHFQTVSQSNWGASSQFLNQILTAVPITSKREAALVVTIRHWRCWVKVTKIIYDANYRFQQPKPVCCNPADKATPTAKQKSATSLFEFGYNGTLLYSLCCPWETAIGLASHQDRIWMHHTTWR